MPGLRPPACLLRACGGELLRAAAGGSAAPWCPPEEEDVRKAYVAQGGRGAERPLPAVSTRPVSGACRGQQFSGAARFAFCCGPAPRVGPAHCGRYNGPLWVIEKQNSSKEG